ncbi:MAG: 2'-deoxycytidine 5'-triphosphate deaminase [Bauldia sp.]
MSDLGSAVGLLPRQRIRALIRRRMVRAKSEIEAGQLQPASLDLRLGSRAFRLRASFLPGKGKTVQEQIDRHASVEVPLDEGAVLERGSVYIVELQEHLALPKVIVGAANPKSSAGRLDIFTRLITDDSEAFDTVASGYDGPLYAEISPRTFPVRVRRGSRLNQIRFRRRNPAQSDYTDFRVPDRDLLARHKEQAIVDGEALIRNGLVLRVDLAGGKNEIMGYRAQRFTDVIDVDRIGAYRVEDFWEPLRARSDRSLILDPNQFYILSSKERIHIPPDLAAEMVPIDPTMGEFRVHYAGFFDPGFGWTEAGQPGARAVLEVRSHEVPFFLGDGQMIGRLVYEKIAERPDRLYGRGLASNYQGQGLKLSKHFVAD